MDKKKVFVIMPFQDEFFEMYEMLKIKFADRFDFSNAGDEANQQNILKDIIQPIYEADIIIADLTGLNANVMYELGLAHSFNKKTIVIKKDDLSKLPFDLKQYRAKDYDTHFKKFAELLDYLEVGLNLTSCIMCGNKKEIVTLSSEKGGLICKDCYVGERIVPISIVKILNMYYLVDIKSISKLSIKEEVINEINRFLTSYYDDYTGLYLKSKDFLKTIQKL